MPLWYRLGCLCAIDIPARRRQCKVQNRESTGCVSHWGVRCSYKPDQKGREGSGAPMSETNAVIPSLLSEYLGTSGEPQEKGVKNWGSKIFLSPRDNLCARWRGGGRAYDERNLV